MVPITCKYPIVISDVSKILRSMNLRVNMKSCYSKEQSINKIVKVCSNDSLKNCSCTYLHFELDMAHSMFCKIRAKLYQWNTGWQPIFFFLLAAPFQQHRQQQFPPVRLHPPARCGQHRGAGCPSGCRSRGHVGRG